MHVETLCSQVAETARHGWDTKPSEYSKGGKLFLPVTGVYPTAYCLLHEQRTQEVSIITNQEGRKLTLDITCRNHNKRPPHSSCVDSR